jgi:heat shock protein HslJ
MIKYFIFSLVFLSACQVKKEQTQNADITQLHHIWALHSLNGEDYSNDMSQKHPTLEIFVAEKRVAGNDGCNQIFGGMAILTDTDLKFGMLAGTKMACSDMELADAFGKALGMVEHYVVQDLTLTLQDKDRNELMVLRKVD